ncbi:hypothetical protein BP6252_01674 [Coleophoma cylindrospora]|uniref:MaoC-like domain-containing protein n=1 Tax=Coleophoma cylindrospora TaxID=1849047 RepID=A0A3D8STK8_9HELO|nr:hypothetical protein BP6252_01674 [Coleophoma cylindrospora]
MSSFNLWRTAFTAAPRTARHHVQARKSIHTWSSVSELEAALREDLTSRPPNVIYDDMSKIPSHLLNLSLSSFLPKSCQPASSRSGEGCLTELPYLRNRITLPLGHHLVHFPPQILNDQLLPDGTDNLQSPGVPFVRRMWAGGSVTYNNTELSKWNLDERPQTLSCVERVTDVRVKGVSGEEKVFVEIQRDIAPAGHERPDLVGRVPLISEIRNLVFMRAKSAEDARLDTSRIGRIVKAPHEPDFSVSMTPDRTLLFRFSALTFNAHAIHLDREYARGVEGHRDLLVHGPLTLVLMLSVVRSQLGDQSSAHSNSSSHQIKVKKFEYKNLAPLYVEEEMKICFRRSRRQNQASVWIENRDGGLAVKGAVEFEAVL